MCTDEKEDEELTKMDGLLWWQGYDKDPGGFQKTMWCGIIQEFDYKVSFTWSVCGREREEACTHRHSSPDKKEETSQLDYIIGPMRRDDEIYIHNESRLWATLDHYPIFARIEEEVHTKKFQRRNKKWTGWTPITEEPEIHQKE